MSGLSDMLLIVVNGKNIYWPLETFTLVWSRSYKHKTKQKTKQNKQSSHGLVSLQGGNRHKGKTAHTSTNESDSVHASPVILQTYASSSTVSTMSAKQ